MKDIVCMRISTDDRVEMLDTFFINYYALLQFYMRMNFVEILIKILDCLQLR